MFHKIAKLLGLIVWAFPVWADQQKPVQTIEEAYKLALETASDYPANIRNMSLHFPNMATNTKIRIDNLSDIFGQPNKDVWRGRITISNPTGFRHLRKSKPSNLICTRIGQSTLAHLRQVFPSTNNMNTPKGANAEQYAIVKIFSDVPKTAVAMQVCVLNDRLPMYKTGEEIYKDLMQVIGNRFSNISERRHKDGKFIFYNFKGPGRQNLNGAAVISMQVNMTESLEFGRELGVAFVVVSYLMPSNS